MLFAALLAAGCRHDLGDKIDFKVSLADDNTYFAGDPVTFLIDGEVDNLLFFSGENGHNYDYRDRTAVEDMELVKTAGLDLELRGRYGKRAWDATTGENEDQQFEVYVLKPGKTFAGLSKDAAKDAEMIAAMEASSMADWDRIEYVDLKANDDKWNTKLDIDLKNYLGNFVLALHWKPVEEKGTWRWWWLRARMAVAIEGFEPTESKLLDLGFNFFMKHAENPYHVNTNGSGPDGSIILNSAAAELQFRGGKKAACDPETWAFSTPMALNRVEKDRGAVIKNLQNYLPSYTYIFEEPGTYKVVFVGSNTTIADSSHQVVEKTVTILERPLK